MRYTLLLIMGFCLFLANVEAQITITNATFPQVGDTLRTVIDGAPSGVEINPPGGTVGHDWNFSTLLGVSREQVMRPASEGTNFGAFPSADIVTAFGPLGEAYYRITDTNYELIGYDGPDPANLGLDLTVKLSPVLKERHAPLEFTDSYTADAAILLPIGSDQLPSEILDSLDITPDSLRLRIAIERTASVDGWGTVAIPGGVYDVIREKNIEERDTRLDVKIGIGPFSTWVDVTDVVPFFDFVGKDTISTYRFLSDEAKEPIAVVTVDNMNNDIVQLVEYKYNDVTTNVSYINNGRPDILAYPNPAIEDVRFEFLNLNPGKYRLKIYNILGIVVWERNYSISDDRTEKIDLSGLRKGTYLYSLINEKGKTVATKRLMVMRP